MGAFLYGFLKGSVYALAVMFIFWFFVQLYGTF